jgi:exosome complex exonuclease DIS3/RRP44
MFLKEPSQTADEVKLKLFDRIIVKISIDTKNVQHQKMKLQLVSPNVFIHFIFFLSIRF